ncbi:MAG: glutathione S-transferase family protein [Pseudomonadota bacterium]
MKLYDFGPAANAKRVRVFLAEKSVEIEKVELDVRADAQLVEPYKSMNPFHCVPFLELDDGTIIAESIAICRYVEAMHPEPSLFGRSDQEQATIEMWLRRVELDMFLPLLHALRNHVPMFAGRVVPGTRTDLPQLPEMVQRGKEMAAIFMDRVDPLMANREFIVADRFTMPDLVAALTLNSAKMLGMELEGWPNIARWHAAIAARPSMEA